MIYKFKEFKKPNVLKNHLNLGGVDKDGNVLGLNSLTLTKNDKPFIGIMGEIHYNRVPRESWKEALELMKAGGIQIVSTYVIWIYHETTEGHIDWSKDNDLRTFVKLAQELGLQICIRIGPWCHGEVRNGGFPDWLLEKNIKLRENNEEYLSIVKNWFAAISSQLSGLLYKDGGPIIMCQIENELTDNAEHLLTLKNIAMEVGIDVPYYTVTGWNAINGAKIPLDDVLPMFGGYVDAPWDEGMEQLPACNRYSFTGIRNDSAIGKDLLKAKAEDHWELPYDRYPYGTCEIGGGLMNTYHRRYVIRAMDIYAMTMIMLCEGANILGYYMYHGGINKVAKDYTLQESKATGYPNDYPIISYDFQAPVSSYNETRESYDLLNLLHIFIKEYESKLALMTYLPAETDIPASDFKSLRYGMRTDGNSGFVFINHYQRLHELEDLEGVIIDTGTVKFPPIDIKGQISFFMPFNMELGKDSILTFATAQPLCKTGDTWLFLEIPGIKPTFEFRDPEKATQIILLNLDEAKSLRKVDSKVYFESKVGKTILDLLSSTEDDYELTILSESAFEIPSMYQHELQYQNTNATWYKISVDDSEGFINIKLKADVMQLYIDGNLVDDDFYHGLPWRLPKKLIYDHEAYIVTTPCISEVYIEQP